MINHRFSRFIIVATFVVLLQPAGALLFEEMVEATGIEPATSCVQSRRSTN
jgi:hypothetical protein